MLIRNRGVIAPLGLLCLSISVVVGKVGPGTIPGGDFFEGLFAGLALALSVGGLIVQGLSRGE